MFTILHESLGMRKLVSKWVPSFHYYTPETKRSSAEWTAAGESRPKRLKILQWAGKVTLFVFWDAYGILFMDYLKKGKTINSDYYMALLDRLSAEIKEKRSHMQKKKLLFHQDNAPYHNSMKTMVKLNELSFELLPHPPYSSDLNPSDYWIFASLKEVLQGRRSKCITLEGNYIDE